MVEKVQTSPALKRLGKSVYMATAVIKSVAWNNLPVSITITDEKSMVSTIVSPMYMGCIGNGKYFGGNLSPCPKAVLNDGLFDIFIAKDIKFIEGITTLRPGMQDGTAAYNLDDGKKGAYLRGFKVVAKPEVDKPVPVEVDGEFAGILPAEFNTLPLSWKFLIPKMSWIR